MYQSVYLITIKPQLHSSKRLVVIALHGNR